MTPMIGVVLVMLTAATPEASLLSQAGTLWERCAKEDPEACYRLECMRTVRIMDAALRSEATAIHEAGCKDKDPAACFALGMYLDDDGGIPIDGKRAFDLFTSACAAGFAPACLRTSIFYRVSVPSLEPGAPQRASALLREACDAGFPLACHDLAEAGKVGGATPVDDATAAKLLDRGCTRGSFQACVTIAERLLPEPPFACDQCEPNPIERGDAHCIDCEIAICRTENCCPTCENHLTYACCAEEFDQPLRFPLVTPTPDPKQVARARKAAHSTLEPSVRRLEALCAGGFAPACRDLARLYSMERLPFFDEGKAAIMMERASQLDGDR